MPEAPAVHVRLESGADRAAIHALHAAAFPTPAEAALVHALRAAGRLSLSLVALERSELIGHVAFSPVTVDRGAAGLGLGPLAVRADQRRRGIGEQLVRAGLAACRNAGTGYVVVPGDPRCYSRFGFAPAQRWALDGECGGDAFQAIELVPGAIPAQGGRVRYAPEFAALGV